MLVFIDESYEQLEDGTWCYALGGFGIDEHRYRSFQAAMFQLCHKYFDVKENYPDDSWREALTQKIISNQPPDEIELKASELLKSGSLRRFGGHESPHYRLTSAVFDKIYEARGTSFGVLLKPDHPNDVKNVGTGCPTAYKELFQLISKSIREQKTPNQLKSATLIMDTEHEGINLPLSRSIANYLYKSTKGKQLTEIVPAPLWVDSKTMAGSQAADLIAHCLMNSIKPAREQKPIDSLISQVYGLSYKWLAGNGGTIRKLQKRQLHKK